MIGFELTATSNIGFNRNRGAWTEGSLWLAKGAVSVAKPKGTGMFTPDFMSAIDGKFTEIKDILLKRVGAVENLFFLNVTGDIILSVKFDPSKPIYMNTWRLVRGINQNSVEIGDQVMIYLCKTIIAFDDHISIFGYSGNIIPLLTVNLKL